MVENLSKIIIIDGYNLIEATPEQFKKMPTLENRRNHLLKMIQSTPQLKNITVYVIFDGKSSERNHLKYRQKNISIIFSGKEQDADAVIQKMIRQNASRKSLHIISSDREIQHTARDHHARISSSQEFWKQLRDKRPVQTNLNKSVSGGEKELNKSEVQEWLDIFNKGKPENHED